mmetsp:Transcript_8011/g.18652  ORF Transcript_8011/g.18652 Transcript_8011/m.18652 type:complete len:247 (-) Transcript_8011:419-1159(-)
MHGEAFFDFCKLQGLVAGRAADGVAGVAAACAVRNRSSMASRTCRSCSRQRSYQSRHSGREPAASKKSYCCTLYARQFEAPRTMAPKSARTPSGMKLPVFKRETRRPPISIWARPATSTPKCGPAGCESGIGSQASPGGMSMRSACKATIAAHGSCAGMSRGSAHIGTHCWDCWHLSYAKSNRDSLTRLNLARSKTSCRSSTTMQSCNACTVAVRTCSSPMSAASPKEAPGPRTPTAPISLECTDA